MNELKTALLKYAHARYNPEDDSLYRQVGRTIIIGSSRATSPPKFPDSDLSYNTLYDAP